MTTTIKHINWVTPSYEDRLILSLATHVERAVYHTVIKGVVYGVVRREHHGTYHYTYKVGPDGIAHDCNSGMGGIPLHYQLIHGNAVSFISCSNDYNQGCSLCRKKEEEAA